MNQETKFQLGTVIATSVVICAMIFVHPIYNALRTFELKLGTAVNEIVGTSPAWPEKLKVLVYDDKAAASTGKGFLDEGEWADLLGAINKQKPKTILIDKIFAVSVSPDQSGLKKLQDELRNGGNIWTGINIFDVKLPFQQPLNLSETPGKLVFPVKFKGNSNSRLVYGTMPELQNTLKGSGHLSYIGGGTSKLLEIFPDIQMALGHLALAAADDVGLNGTDLIVDGIPLATDLGGNTPTFLNMKSFQRNMKTLTGVFERIKDHAPIEFIHAGDTVLILPLTYTGNTDMDNALFGGTPKGYVLASLVRSVVSRDWLFHSRLNFINLLVLIVLGVCWGQGSPRKTWLAGTLAVGGSLAGLSLLAFAYLAIDLDWVILTTAFLTPAIVVHLRRLRSDLQNTLNTMNTLSRALPPKLKDELLANPDLLIRQPSEKIVTLMFIDIVNFSIYAESHQPKEVFETLKEYLMEMTNIITNCHGIVDKTLGDGLLAIFGYDFTGREAATNQADAAIKAAIAIQNCNYLRSIYAVAAGNVALPLRIGINTAAVYLGDLDGQNRFDFTVIGHGVNFTQRLENACDAGGILVSNTTYEVSNHFRSVAGSFVRRLINIKHHDELFDVYFCDPLHDNFELKKSFGDAVRSGHCAERSEKRFAIESRKVLRVEIESIGEVEITDFSRSGCCLYSKKFLSRGVKVRASIKFGTEEALTVYAEVRWAFQQAEQKYMHGLKFINASDQDLDDLYRKFSDVPIAKLAVA